MLTIVSWKTAYGIQSGISFHEKLLSMHTPA